MGERELAGSPAARNHGKGKAVEEEEEEAGEQLWERNRSSLASHEKYRQEKECLEESNPINGCME